MERPSHTHNLKELLDLLEKNGLKIPKYVRLAKELTRFAGKPRYPESSSPVSKREHGHVVRVADAVFRWAARQIEGRSP